jgi:anaerobic C4-dicarboxylate transporter
MYIIVTLKKLLAFSDQRYDIGMTIISSAPPVVITIVPIVTHVAAKEIKDDRPLALGAAGVGLREHDIHEAAWAGC